MLSYQSLPLPCLPYVHTCMHTYKQVNIIDIFSLPSDGCAFPLQVAGFQSTKVNPDTTRMPLTQLIAPVRFPEISCLVPFFSIGRVSRLHPMAAMHVLYVCEGGRVSRTLSHHYLWHIVTFLAESGSCDHLVVASSNSSLVGTAYFKWLYSLIHC